MFVIHRSLEEVAGRFGPCALSIGNFDGVHVGHRRILRRVAALAGERGWKASVLTFDPHPARIVAPSRAPRLLTTPEERAALMREEGIEQVLVMPFTREVSHFSPEQFVRSVLKEKLDARAVLVGENFRFGYRHAGDTHALRELGTKYGFHTEVVPGATLRRHLVSSSTVRRLIEHGEVLLAGRLLERPHVLEGPVVPGHGVGAKFTVPTLNLAPAGEVLPAAGVYITRAQGRWPAVTNVGRRPTFGGDTLSIETFLLNPLEGPAPERLRVEFLRRLREERKFPGPEELKAQILRDVARARAFFRRVEKIA